MTKWTIANTGATGFGDHDNARLAEINSGEARFRIRDNGAALTAIPERCGTASANDARSFATMGPRAGAGERP